MKKKERGPEDETLMNVFVTAGTAAEVEAQAIHGLLEANAIESFIVRDNVPEIPVGRVEIRVPASMAERAKQIIIEAQKAGPAAAHEAEAESEL